MELTAFSCAAYKAFRDSAEIELRPLTVILGKNNAGKSVLARLPLLLLASLITERGSPLELRVGSLEFGDTVRDLVYGRWPHGAATLSATFEEAGERLRIEARIQNITRTDRELEEAVVAHWTLQGALTANLEWEASPGMPTRYREWGEIEFRGLLPKSSGSLPPGLRHGLDEWRQRIEALRSRVAYLGPFRRPIPRYCSRGAMKQTAVGEYGENAPHLIAADERLREHVARWFRDHMEGWDLGLHHSGEVFACVLRRGGMATNVVDAGEGITQVLPVVVQQCLHRTRAEGPVLDIVEHPELHLHPAAHAGLADLYLDSVGTAGARIIVETHSENFLLRLRRRVAEGQIDPSQVALYWVDDGNGEGPSIVQPIKLYADGRVEPWPEGVFSEGYGEVVALRRAVRRQAKI